MKTKIVIITSTYLHPFVEKAFEEFKEQINAEEQKEINELVSFKFRTGSDESED